MAHQRFQHFDCNSKAPIKKENANQNIRPKYFMPTHPKIGGGKGGVKGGGVSDGVYCFTIDCLSIRLSQT